MSDKRKISDLIPDHANANKGTERGRYALESSLRQFGAGRSILLDKNGRIIAGNKTVEVAADVGLDDVLIVQTDGKQIVAVQRTDLDIDSPEGRGLAYADNRVGELSLDWDAEQVLADLNAGMDLSALWKQDELDELIADLQPKGTEGDTEPQIARAEELRQKWGVEPGQLWQLGEHRLICGDCTDAAVVARVMAGEKANMVFTDPPYNVASESRNYAADKSKAMMDLSVSEWDKNFNIKSIFPVLDSVIAPDCAVYICTSQWLVQTIWEWMRSWSDFCSYCVWCKPNPMPSLSKRHWTWATELIPYAVRGHHVSNFPDGNHALNWWDIPKSKETEHPTEKVLAVPVRAIEFSSNRDAIIFDGFSGSGTTLIACENLGRRCRAVEIAPGYVAVALERWAVHTGKTPVIIPNGTT